MLDTETRHKRGISDFKLYSIDPHAMLEILHSSDVLGVFKRTEYIATLTRKQ